MFAELFGGGRADLALMDESDPLNCGIEITAKPPGKQLQGVSLLSGGERTMTAVALLFAIYMVRPSPFCVLDELDAPLDESNINRFIRMLERFVEQSQFIIITHNKRTIAKADVIYGVTMEERGISKLVGMKMTDRAPADFRAGSERVGSQREFAIAENGNGHGEHASAGGR
jgi:chromosome segregation protein